MIVGVIAPSAGVGLAALSGSNALWTARLRLVCWQQSDGTVAVDRLTLVSREMPQDKAARLVNGFAGYDVVRCEFSARTLLTRPVRVVPSAELAAVVERLRRPVVLDHDLGRFTYTLESDSFDGELSLAGTVAVRLGTADTGMAGRLLDQLSTALASTTLTSGLIIERAVADLLETANDEWWYGEEPLTDTDFGSRLDFHTLAIGDDGEFEAFCHDGDIFSGHAVLVRGSLTEGPTEATVAG